MDGASPFNWLEPLNRREVEILRLVSTGLSNREISQRLHLSLETVKWYNKRIFSKLGVSNRTRAVKIAGQHGLLEPAPLSEVEAESHPPGNLPAQVTSYVGRKTELDAIKGLLKTTRLVVLTGSGGTGKTRLALQVARDLAGSYRNGVWLVELSQVSDPGHVVNAIIQSLKANLNPGAAPVEVLARFLKHKHLLLLLDNFEHLLGAAPLVTELLSCAPQVTVLTTSRERLHVYGETEYPVLPLQLPDLKVKESAERLLQCDAVDLFIQRARAARPGFTAAPDQVAAIARICVQLDGLPLAIELAASQVKIFSPAVLVGRIQAGLDALPDGPRDFPSRQRTLQATIEWSYNLLQEDEKSLFARLSIFRGGGTLDSVEQVCRQGKSDHVLEALAALVDKSLVDTRETPEGDLRFSMLETLREYARERLEASKELEFFSRLHAEHFTEIAETASSEIQGIRHRYWYARLQSEQDNLRAALAWSFGGGELSCGLRMVAALQYFWRYILLPSEGWHWVELALKRLEDAPLDLRARVFSTAGNLAYDRGDLEKSRVFLRQASELFQELGDERNAAWSSISLCMAEIDTPQGIQQSMIKARSGLEVLQRLRDQPGIAFAHNVLGELKRLAGDYQSAREDYEKCLAIVKETGEWLREAMQYDNLGVIAIYQNDPLRAEQLIKAGLKICQELGTSLGLATMLGSLAGPTAALGHPGRAARLLGAANAQLEFLGSDQQPADQPEITRFFEAVLRELGEEAFQAAWQAGQELTTQQAIAFALEGLQDHP